MKALDSKILNQAGALLAGVRQTRVPALVAKIELVRSEAVLNGVLVSSGTVKGICEACTEEARELATIAWEAIRRVHQSMGAPRHADLRAVITELLSRERTILEMRQREYTDRVGDELTNHAITTPLLQLMPTAFHEALERFRAEVEVYMAELEVKEGPTMLGLLRRRAENQPILVWGIGTAAVLLFLVGVVDGIVKLARLITN